MAELGSAPWFGVLGTPQWGGGFLPLSLLPIARHSLIVCCPGPKGTRYRAEPCPRIMEQPWPCPHPQRAPPGPGGLHPTRTRSPAVGTAGRRWWHCPWCHVCPKEVGVALPQQDGLIRIPGHLPLGCCWDGDGRASLSPKGPCPKGSPSPGVSPLVPRGFHPRKLFGSVPAGMWI